MNVELICVGTEILLGNIVNTNAAYLSEKCAGLGLSCYFQTVVGDNEERLSQVLETAVGRSDIVILSGGLGRPRSAAGSCICMSPVSGPLRNILQGGA